MPSLRQSRPGAPKRQPPTARSSAAAVGLGLLLVTGLLGSASACGAGPTIPDRFIYVTNQLDNTLSVIDGSTYQLVANRAGRCLSRGGGGVSGRQACVHRPGRG